MEMTFFLRFYKFTRVFSLMKRNHVFVPITITVYRVQSIRIQAQRHYLKWQEFWRVFHEKSNGVHDERLCSVSGMLKNLD